MIITMTSTGIVRFLLFSAELCECWTKMTPQAPIRDRGSFSASDSCRASPLSPYATADLSSVAFPSEKTDEIHRVSAEQLCRDG